MKFQTLQTALQATWDRRVGGVMTLARRLALLSWAERAGAYVLEDDYDSEYRYDRAPVGTLQRLAPDRPQRDSASGSMRPPRGAPRSCSATARKTLPPSLPRLTAKLTRMVN